MVRIKGDYQLDTDTLDMERGYSSIYQTNNTTGDGSVSQMDKLRSKVLIHLDKCSQSKSNTSEVSNV